MIKKSILLCAVAGVLNSGYAGAATYGAGSQFDARIQSVTYNENDVVNVRVKKGTVSVVQVAKDETIKDIGLGDPAAWKVSVRDQSVFFRPVVDDNPNTNVTIVTNKHTYPLYLVSVASNPTYILRYDYPKPPVKSVFAENNYPCTDGGVINGHYQLRGDKTIYPYQIWDDGTFTCMRWKSQQEMPVVYRVDADGNEHLVNGDPNKNTMVYFEVNNHFRLRLGDQVADVRTSSIVNKGWNAKATTNGQTRTEKFNYEQ
ncbi:TrbG/VirB9 family P-type conjugative transfer protein [Salmonella enterica]